MPYFAPHLYLFIPPHSQVMYTTFNSGAVDPRTNCFAEFPAWVTKHGADLAGKRVLLYCTGGVRCEKASAVVRAMGVAKEVFHLQGGIHKYLDAFEVSLMSCILYLCIKPAICYSKAPRMSSHVLLCHLLITSPSYVMYRSYDPLMISATHILTY